MLQLDRGVLLTWRRLWPKTDVRFLWDDPVFNNLVLYRIYSETAVIIENEALANEAEKVR